MDAGNKLITLIMFMYRVDGEAGNFTFNPGPHKGGVKSYPILVDRVGHIDLHKNISMIKSDLETFKANFDRSEPFKYTANGITIIPKEIGFISYKLLIRHGNVVTELGSQTWNRQEGRWKVNKKG